MGGRTQSPCDRPVTSPNGPRCSISPRSPSSREGDGAVLQSAGGTVRSSFDSRAAGKAVAEYARPRAPQVFQAAGRVFRDPRDTFRVRGDRLSRSRGPDTSCPTNDHYPRSRELIESFVWNHPSRLKIKNWEGAGRGESGAGKVGEPVSGELRRSPAQLSSGACSSWRGFLAESARRNRVRDFGSPQVSSGTAPWAPQEWSER